MEEQELRREAPLCCVECEEQQLRLGLGQVLRYRHLFTARYDKVRALLIAVQEPRDSSWRDLCRDLDVLLVSPQRFDEVIAATRDGTTDPL